MASFSIISTRSAGVHFLTPLGKLDGATAGILQREFDAVARSNAVVIVVDLSRLSLLTDAGIDMLLRIKATCEGNPGRLRVFNGSRPIARALEIAGARDRLPIMPVGTADRTPI